MFFPNDIVQRKLYIVQCTQTQNILYNIHTVYIIVYNMIFEIIEPEAGLPFTSYNSSLHNAFVITVLKT